MTLPDSEMLKQVVIIALVAMNVFTFFIFGFDKWMATTHSWRVPEAVLWTCAAFGGSVGALTAMNVFRHKTKKASFQLVMAIILLLQGLCIWYIFFYTAGTNLQTPNNYSL